MANYQYTHTINHLSFIINHYKNRAHMVIKSVPITNTQA